MSAPPKLPADAGANSSRPLEDRAYSVDRHHPVVRGHLAVPHLHHHQVPVSADPDGEQRNARAQAATGMAHRFQLMFKNAGSLANFSGIAFLRTTNGLNSGEFSCDDLTGNGELIRLTAVKEIIDF